MDEKRHKTSIEKHGDVEYFRNVGVRASDVFYVNQDRRTEAQKALKGKSNAVAIKLREDYNHHANETRKRMAQEADARRIQQEKLLEEDRLAKLKKLEAKRQLR